MYIVGAANILSQGRVVVAGLFRKHVDRVCLIIDIETEMILVTPVQDDDPNDFGLVQTIDKKNRLVLPKWIIEELGNCKRLFFIVDGDKHYLSPKTGSILPIEDDLAPR